MFVSKRKGRRFFERRPGGHARFLFALPIWIPFLSVALVVARLQGNVSVADLDSFSLSVADWASFRFGQGNIEILDAKRKNPRLAFLIDTGFIDTWAGGSFLPCVSLPPLKFVSQKKSRFLSRFLSQFWALLILG